MHGFVCWSLVGDQTECRDRGGIFGMLNGIDEPGGGAAQKTPHEERLAGRRCVVCLFNDSRVKPLSALLFAAQADSSIRLSGQFAAEVRECNGSRRLIGGRRPVAFGK